MKIAQIGETTITKTIEIITNVEEEVEVGEVGGLEIMTIAAEVVEEGRIQVDTFPLRLLCI